MATQSYDNRRMSTRQFVVDTWQAIIEGRIDRLVLDPSRLQPDDWAPLLWAASEYHLPVELSFSGTRRDGDGHFAFVGEVDDGPPHTSCLRWGNNWWEVWHHDVPLSISPRASWILRAISTTGVNSPVSLVEINRQLSLWGQPFVRESNFRSGVRAVRGRIGPSHIITVPQRGYLWKSCKV
ncbi:hypothetical protein [Sulfobacillus harzensis]|uniref:Uncharacterized protein n=1 Tax=Sulfobacillus harzensis TaxID=2729629 RepID=A0A7Y0L4I0_9FIRM|nr:hypothetical protein [Sulfobacillus harzensis]NMP23172.1 hypothetical protein [Sulfobacillus harzensis]